VETLADLAEVRVARAYAEGLFDGDRLERLGISRPSSKSSKSTPGCDIGPGGVNAITNSVKIAVLFFSL